MKVAYICRFCATAAGWYMPAAAFNGERRQCGVCGNWRNVIDTELLGHDP